MHPNDQNNKIILYGTIAILALFFIGSISRCGSRQERYDNNQSSQTKVTGPVDSLLKVYKDKKDLTIILSDMDYLEDNDLYRHKYHIVYSDKTRSKITQADSIRQNDSSKVEVQAKVDSTDWIKVSDVYFDKYINDLGMEIAAIDSGKVRKGAAPAGYTNYVGNSNYGYWSGNNNWMFYPRFSFFDAWLLYNLYPVRYSYWNTYHTGYYGTGRSYYGSGAYGTNGTVAKNYNNKNWTKKSPSKRRSIRNKTRASASRKTSFGGKRSSSRYGSSGRSRGSSFGK